jgi:DNA-binding MarR family transcriptional regulator
MTQGENQASVNGRKETSAMDDELRKIMGCTCMRMRRATRRVTQLYDQVLEPAGLTANQFGLLAYLQGARTARSDASSIGTIAEWLGMDPSTLNRNLKPLEAKGLVRNARDPADGRVRIVQITDVGQRVFLRAVPLWRGAQAQVDNALGPAATATLNQLLDISASSVRSVG